ncbi:hypothetical protein [Mycoplasmopsis lipofaciens]|uniref:hypothetical protein n=1 Tax=Mycoplasmopsis lipofaciens TaxID=114884 RepID=UPI00047FC451|nr:hypothetical protein [Mycoplasmopsis lipofaciens]
MKLSKKGIIGISLGIGIPVAIGAIVGTSILTYKHIKQARLTFNNKSYLNSSFFPTIEYRFNDNDSENLIRKEEITENNENKVIYNNVTNLLDKADINIFGFSTSVQPFYDFIRLALLSKSETYFTYFDYDDNRNLQINGQELERALNYNRLINNDTKKKSKVIGFKRDVSHGPRQIVDKMHDIIRNNRNKKINIWIPSNEISWAPNILELTGYRNVKLMCLNEANSILSAYENSFNEILNKIDINKESSIDNIIENVDDFNKGGNQLNYISLSTFIPNIYYFFEDNETVKKFKNNFPWLKRFYTYSVDPDYRIKNEFFNYRVKVIDNEKTTDFNNPIYKTKDNGELVKNRFFLTDIWAKITGKDWRTEKNKVKEVQEKSNKPKLIYLGGDDAKNEKNDLAYLIDKYQDEYNIYYKGHPNFSVIDNWIKSTVLAHEELTFVSNLDEKIHTTYLKEGNYLTILNNQIRSEELTSEHAHDEDGLWFEKWAVTDVTTGALRSFVTSNSRNKPSDLVFAGVYLRDSESHIIKRIFTTPDQEIANNPKSKENVKNWNDYVRNNAVLKPAFDKENI